MTGSSDAHLSRVVEFYGQRENEEDRLDSDIGRLELARVRELMPRFLPTSPASVLDVGGGTGRHASWLAERGYTVRLVDPVPVHVERALARVARGPTFAASLGDARSLSDPDGSHDAVLLFGPLYHLSSAADRRLALTEALRVLRPGGVLLAIVISRLAGVLDSLRGAFVDTGFGEVGNFHDPITAGDEVRAAGFDLEAVLGVEGPGWLFDNLAQRWADDAAREQVLAVARTVEAEPSLLGLNAHLFIAARRPAVIRSTRARHRGTTP